MSEPLHILGGGSVGLLWAARFAQAGVQCRLILRTPQAAAEWQARDNRLILEQQGTRHALQVPCELADAPSPIHHLIVATKAWATAEAVDQIAPRLRDSSQLLLLQNGLGSQQAVSAGFPAQQVLYASVTDGAWKRAANHVVWAGIGQTLIGDPHPRPAPAWLSLLSQANIVWQWESDILTVLWLKLAVNCAINPITALHDCPNGEVVERAGQSFAPLLAELHALLTSQGVHMSLAELQQRILQVIQTTAANSSSMRQDLRAGRRTEIDFILGHAYRTARREGLSTPTLDSLYRQLQTHLGQCGLPQD
ncbi:MAG: 2-dehydropantoate 2-reductase [Pseudomonas sp.]